MGWHPWPAGGPGRRAAGAAWRAAAQPIHTNNLDSYTVTAFADETGAEASWAVQAFAVCADPLPGLQIINEPTDPASTDYQRVAAFCPSGTRALGGGGRVQGGQNQVHLYNAGAPSGNVNNGSQAFAREDRTGFTGNWTVTAYSVCAAVDVGSVDTVGEGSPVDSRSPKSVTPTCPTGVRITSGAAYVSDGGTTGHPDLVLTGAVPQVLSGGAPGTEIDVFGRENTATNDTWRLVGSAYCAA